MIFERKLGRAAFVSHQWIGGAHPDPEFKQMQVLKDSLRSSHEIFIVGYLSSCDAFLLKSVIALIGTEPSRGVFVLIQNYSSVVAQFFHKIKPSTHRGSLWRAQEISSPVRARCLWTC